MSCRRSPTRRRRRRRRRPARSEPTFPEPRRPDDLVAFDGARLVKYYWRLEVVPETVEDSGPDESVGMFFGVDLARHGPTPEPAYEREHTREGGFEGRVAQPTADVILQQRKLGRRSATPCHGSSSSGFHRSRSESPGPATPLPVFGSFARADHVRGRPEPRYWASGTSRRSPPPRRAPRVRSHTRRSRDPRASSGEAVSAAELSAAGSWRRGRRRGAPVATRAEVSAVSRRR